MNKEELEAVENRPIQICNLQFWDNRKPIKFRDYKRNPIEFLERVGRKYNKKLRDNMFCNKEYAAWMFQKYDGQLVDRDQAGDRLL